MESELAAEAVLAVAVGLVPMLLGDFLSRVGWSTVCPRIGLEKTKVDEAASTAAKKGDKRICLRSFGTSTHHVDC
jgi:hypothetical protein